MSLNKLLCFRMSYGISMTLSVIFSIPIQTKLAIGFIKYVLLYHQIIFDIRVLPNLLPHPILLSLVSV